jgi:phospholipase/carboxylesterase
MNRNYCIKIFYSFLFFRMTLFSCTSLQETAVQRTINVNSRTIMIQFPVPFDTLKSYPLLIALHGNGGNASDLASWFGYYKDKPLIIALPQGQYASAYGTGYSWFYETKDRSKWEEADSLSVENILSVINEVTSNHKIDGVYMMGFSQGASLAYMTGLKNPGRITGIIAVAGILPEIGQIGSVLKVHDIQKASQVRILIARGISDNMVSRAYFTKQKTFFNIQGFPVTDMEFTGGHTLTKELLDYMFQWILMEYNHF